VRIIAGAAKGRRLVGPSGDATRPMTDRVREALFSSLGSLVDGSRVLDLYAGTGSVGLEALSRGASQGTFVERHRGALRALRTNLTAVGLGGEVIADDVDRFLRRPGDSYDLVFVDPPYAVPLASLLETIEALVRRVAAGGVVVIHRRFGEDLPETVAGLVLTDRRRYGSAELWRYAKESQ